MSSNFIKRELPFSHGFKSRKQIGYRAMNHVVMIMCADRADWSCQIRRYNNLPPYVTVNMAATHINTGVKKRPNSPFKILNFILKYVMQYIRGGFQDCQLFRIAWCEKPKNLVFCTHQTVQFWLQEKGTSKKKKKKKKKKKLCALFFSYFYLRIYI